MKSLSQIVREFYIKTNKDLVTIKEESVRLLVLNY